MAQFFKLLAFRAAILVAMQVYPNAQVCKCLEFVINIYNTSVVGRIGNIEGDDMQVLTDVIVYLYQFFFFGLPVENVSCYSAIDTDALVIIFVC